MRGPFPPSAYALATSDWYFNSGDHRCPHDAWLESLSLTEPSSGERHEIRTLSLRVRLLGAYHDGYVELLYPQVFACRLSVERGESGHRGWRYDELRLSSQGRLIHEVEWCGRDDTAIDNFRLIFGAVALDVPVPKTIGLAAVPLSVLVAVIELATFAVARIWMWGAPDRHRPTI